MDLVIGGGAIFSQILAAELPRRGLLPTPVIAPLIIDAELQGVPRVDDRSATPNLPSRFTTAAAGMLARGLVDRGLPASAVDTWLLE